jgi:hypothetical protein
MIFVYGYLILSPGLENLGASQPHPQGLRGLSDQSSHELKSLIAM